MTYQVLARKWRPQDFSGVIGQEPIITALRNGLKENRVAQAYLFSGIRGVGKTTAARVLAKALNCERGPEPGRPSEDPCSECLPCCEITAGSDMDVLEVDAATYSKVEQVRELTESLRYGPARDRFKVVVLDEVHRLSRQAFDALLKIVEEPPPHLVFIFATTEIDAVPATILSRCQEFQFRRVPSPVLAKHLRKISDAEQIEVSDSAVRLIARAGEGSVRDSVALLDQLATFGNNRISDGDASDLLGGLDAAIFHRVLAAILDGHAGEIIEIAREIEANGWDPHNVFGQFLVYSRDALHLAAGGKAESVDLPLEEAEALAGLVRSRSYENLLRLTDHLLTSEPIVRRSEFALLALELAWLRAAELPKLIRVEEILSGREPTALPEGGSTTPDNRDAGSRFGAASPPVSVEPASSTRPAPVPPTPTNPVPPKVTEERPDRAEPHPMESTGAAASGRMASFRETLNTQRQSLAAMIESARLVFEDGKLRIEPPAGDSLIAGALKRKNNVTLLEELIQRIWGEGATWILQEPSDEAREATISRRESEAEASGEVTEDPTVQAVLEIFGGNIQNVQEQERDSTS